MLGMGSKKICSCSDKISQLPDPIIGRILEFVPFTDAVRTSVLSGEWKYKWFHVSTIQVDNDNVNEFTSREKLLRGVLGMLHAHVGPVVEFCIDLPEMESSPEIDQILNLLSEKSVRRISLSRFLENKPQFLGPSLFSCSQLELLDLIGCHLLHPQPEFTGFAKLAILLLEKVTVAAQVLSTLISQCPLLECLFLTSCSTLSNLEITAPNLKLLRCNTQLEGLVFIAAPRLVDVSIDLPSPTEESTVLQLKFADSIERMHLDYYYMKSLHWCGSRVRFEHLRSLTLSPICFGNLQELKCMLELIKSCASLETVIIEAFVEDVTAGQDDDDDDVMFCDVHDLSGSRVREVQLLDVSGSKNQLAFIKALLLKLLKLETMVIAPAAFEKNGAEENCKLVSQFRRASPLAIVKFRDSNDCKESLLSQELQILKRHLWKNYVE